MKIPDIELVKPVVVLNALKDMNREDKRQAERFLAGTDIINNGKIVHNKYLRDDSIYGSEAVIEYRKQLGLPDVAIRTVSINAVCKAASDFDFLSDFIYLLQRTKNRNDRIYKLTALHAPSIILSLEYRMLWECIEVLLYNRTLSYPVKVGRGKKARVVDSLMDRGLDYTFLINPDLFSNKLWRSSASHNQSALFKPESVTKSSIRTFEASEPFLSEEGLNRLLRDILTGKFSESEDNADEESELHKSEVETLEDDNEEDYDSINFGRNVSVIEENIILPIPIVVQEALKDMTLGEQEQAERFARGYDVLNRGKIKPIEELNRHSLIGSEAIIEYRKFLRLPDVSFQVIPVKEIYESIGDIDTLDDITFFMNRVSFYLDCLSREMEMGVTNKDKDRFLIFVEWCIKIQKRVEYLVDNDWSGKPIAFKAITSNNSEDDEDDENGDERHLRSHIGIKKPGDEDLYDYVRVYRSLKDIGFTAKKLRELSEYYKKIMDEEGISYK